MLYSRFFSGLSLARHCRLAKLFILDRLARSSYRSMTATDLAEKRKSDTVFVFGTGASLLDISSSQWAAISQHDVVSFREFHRQRFVHADFHITAEVDDVDDYARSIRSNPFYNNCCYLIQEGWLAERGNEIVGRRLLPDGVPVVRYKRKSRGVSAAPSRMFEQGIVHGHGSICGVTNICLILGWKRIVLCGIDLYDHRQFYMPPNETRSIEKEGVTFASRYASADQIVDLIGDWADLCRDDGREIYALNPKSLLTRRLPTFDLSTLPEAPNKNG